MAGPYRTSPAAIDSQRCTRGGIRLFWQPLGLAPVSFGQVNQDGIAVREREIAILQHGNLAQRVQLAKPRCATHVGGSRLESIRQAEHPQQQLDAVGVPG